MSKRNNSEVDSWALVVYFDKTRTGKEVEEETVVPIHWLSKSNTKLWWPDNNILTNKINMIPSCEGWSFYLVKKVKFTGKLYSDLD